MPAEFRQHFRVFEAEKDVVRDRFDPRVVDLGHDELILHDAIIHAWSIDSQRVSIYRLTVSTDLRGEIRMPSVAAPATATPRPYPQPIRVPASEIAVIVGGVTMTVDEWTAMPPPCARNENATTDRVLATRS